jgi:hypothetical protein
MAGPAVRPISVLSGLRTTMLGFLNRGRNDHVQDKAALGMTEKLSIKEN